MSRKFFSLIRDYFELLKDKLTTNISEDVSLIFTLDTFCKV